MGFIVPAAFWFQTEALFRMEGELNADDTRIEFVEDVAARAKRFKTLFGWRCPGKAFSSLLPLHGW